MKSPDVSDLNAEHIRARQRWVGLLRSGVYTQTRGRLIDSQDTNRRCCLGVACDPSITGVVGQLDTSDQDYARIVLPSGTYVGFLPTESTDALGLDEIRLGSGASIQTSSGALSTINDMGDYGFDEIADIIEDEFVTPYLHLLEDEDTQ